jgi:starch synthase
MYSLHYGTVPVVHAVGGLADTVYDPQQAAIGKANGFGFNEPDAQALLVAINRALECFRDGKSWRRLQKNGMASDCSWKERARTYSGLYQSILKERDRGGDQHA